MTWPNCAKFCHYMNHQNSPCPSLTPTFLPSYILFAKDKFSLCVELWTWRSCHSNEALTESLRNHLLLLLLVKDMSKIRLIPRAPNSQKLNINVVHLVGFNGLCTSLRTKSQKRLESVPPIPTEHELSFQKV